MSDNGEEEGQEGDQECADDVASWKKFRKFPKIDQYRASVANVNATLQRRAGFVPGSFEAKAAVLEYPTLEFVGSVKLHGTNSSLVISSDGSFHVQSRNRIITVEKDNAGFAAFCAATFVAPLSVGPIPPPMAIYGEWCGQGIQKGVGVSTLPRMFVVFAARTVIDEKPAWLGPDDLKAMTAELKAKSSAPERIFCVFDYPTWKLEINFHPDQLQATSAKLEEITLEVERECPVAQAFGVSGIGEGVVWRCATEGWRSPDYWFKVKGEKHSVTKKKTGAALAPHAVEKEACAVDFVLRTVTENRMEQGLDYLREQEIPVVAKSTGDFVRWLTNDILSEEGDTLAASNLTAKDVSGLISKKASRWFLTKAGR